jgi:hypothetical protein
MSFLVMLKLETAFHVTVILWALLAQSVASGEELAHVMQRLVVLMIELAVYARMDFSTRLLAASCVNAM